jgi:hypothetical protein
MFTAARSSVCTHLHVHHCTLIRLCTPSCSPLHAHPLVHTFMFTTARSSACTLLNVHHCTLIRLCTPSCSPLHAHPLVHSLMFTTTRSSACAHLHVHRCTLIRLYTPSCSPLHAHPCVSHRYNIPSLPQLPPSSRLLQTLWPRLQHYASIGKNDPLFAICQVRGLFKLWFFLFVCLFVVSCSFFLFDISARTQR